MAPLRASRSQRHLNQDGGAQGRVRGGVIDHDPTEGLPVRRWELTDVTIKQDARSGENDDDGGKDGTSANWPWPDWPLPKDFNLLPTHSQEMLRRARAPNKNPNIAIFNKGTGEYERPDLNLHDPAAMISVGKLPSFKDKYPTVPSEPSTEPKEPEIDGTEADDDVDSDKPLTEEPRERTFTVKRWVPVPQPVADRKPEPKYLADRRPGLPPLYGPRSNLAPISNNTGYEPNISSTLVGQGEAVGGSAVAAADQAANASSYRVMADGSNMPIGSGVSLTPSHVPAQGEVKRRQPPPPPKRRKKGGPGRSRKKVAATERATTERSTMAANVPSGPELGEQQDGGSPRDELTAKTATAATAIDQDETRHQTATSGTQLKEGNGTDIEMGEVGIEAEVGSSNSGEETEDEGEGSEEGEIEESGETEPPVSHTVTGVPSAQSEEAYVAPNPTGSQDLTQAPAQAPAQAPQPSVSIQPSSPDSPGHEKQLPTIPQVDADKSDLTPLSASPTT